MLQITWQSLVLVASLSVGFQEAGDGGPKLGKLTLNGTIEVVTDKKDKVEEVKFTPEDSSYGTITLTVDGKLKSFAEVYQKIGSGTVQLEGNVVAKGENELGMKVAKALFVLDGTVRLESDPKGKVKNAVFDAGNEFEVAYDASFKKQMEKRREDGKDPGRTKFRILGTVKVKTVTVKEGRESRKEEIFQLKPVEIEDLAAAAAPEKEKDGE